MDDVTLSKTLCEHCSKKCSGEVLRVQDKYYHVSCFSCKGCGASLASGGFFTRAGHHYCTACYQATYGERCAACGAYVEGEVVSALGNTYHQRCFTCARCRQPFPSGERVTYTGAECLCQRCFAIPAQASPAPSPASPAASPTSSPSRPGPECAGCQLALSEGQALIALERQWHVDCFKCSTCGAVLDGEYMGRDGLPYCERDYQAAYGVACAYCGRFISGKVLQAGDSHHFHPTCARCSKCGDPFGDGEEMYLQGTAIWHPRCGPGPTEGTVLNGHPDAASLASQPALSDPEAPDGHKATNGHARTPDNGHATTPDKDPDGMSSSASEAHTAPGRTVSPGLVLRDYRPRSPAPPSRILTYSYLAAQPAQGLRRPIDPYDRPPKSPHFHRPPCEGTPRPRPGTAPARSGMRALVQGIRPASPRSRSPHMNNEEPISLAHFPGGKRPRGDQPRRIERDDFPAPAYPYADSERRRRWSGSSRGVEDEELEDEDVPDDPKLKREEAELAKISQGLAGVFLASVRRRERSRRPLDPRSAARTPSASREPRDPPRGDYGSPRWTDDDYEAPSHRSSGRSSATLPSYSASALRQPPKPGYGFSARAGGSSYRHGLGSYTALHGVACGVSDADLSSARSDVSASSLSEADRNALSGGGEMYPSATYSSGLRYLPRPSPHLRRSLPSLPHHPPPADPPKLYPAHLLQTTNYRLPVDVDRCHLERHLSDADFEAVFRMSRSDFYRVPEWQRNELKRRNHLF